MSDFNYAIKKTLLHEGGFVNNVNDKGGTTNWGISQRSYPHIDIKNLTKDRAIEIYRQDFWMRYRYERIKNNDVAAKIFDACVNMGPLNAHKCAQRALWACQMPQIKDDGFLGPITLVAIDKANPDAFLAAFRVELSYYYKRLLDKDPSLEVFRNGWLKRAYS